jgi:hypothetical protein
MATVSPIKAAERFAVDDGVREIHGVEFRDDGKRVEFFESGRHVLLYRNLYDRYLTPAQARYLARKLHRLARRIEQRELTGAA